MPANFTEEQRKVIRNSLLTIGYDLIREVGLKKMKVSLIAERAEIATGTFYHFFESKETYVSALIEEQEKVWKEQMISGVKSYGKLTLEQAVRIFRESFRKENNILMEFTLDDWVWLKSHRTKDGLFSKEHDELEVQQYLACIDAVSYTHLDVYKRQTLVRSTARSPMCSRSFSVKRRNSSGVKILAISPSSR